MTTAVWHYAKTIAYAATGNVSTAESQRELFYAAVSRVPETRYLFNNTCIEVLKIAEQMLNREIEYPKQNFDVAFDHLRSAINLEDNLKYDEPCCFSTIRGGHSHLHGNDPFILYED